MDRTPLGGAGGPPLSPRGKGCVPRASAPREIEVTGECSTHTNEMTTPEVCGGGCTRCAHACACFNTSHPGHGGSVVMATHSLGEERAADPQDERAPLELQGRHQLRAGGRQRWPGPRGWMTCRSPAPPVPQRCPPAGDNPPRTPRHAALAPRDKSPIWGAAL